jgi:hypothetical protein
MNMGYYPIQIPYILNDKFADALNYKEERGDQQGFVICWWSMDLLSPEASEEDNIIITDGCIDLVADFGSPGLVLPVTSKLLTASDCSYTNASSAWFAYNGVRSRRLTHRKQTSVNAIIIRASQLKILCKHNK